MCRAHHHCLDLAAGQPTQQHTLWGKEGWGGGGGEKGKGREARHTIVRGGTWHNHTKGGEGATRKTTMSRTQKRTNIA